MPTTPTDFVPGKAAVITALQVSSLESERVSLRHVFSHTNWSLIQASSLREALAIVGRCEIPVVICARNLPDGSWRELFEATGARASLIVTARRADESLWTEVLSGGGYDVLASPFHAREVIHVVAMAWHAWRREAAARRLGAARTNSATVKEAAAC